MPVTTQGEMPARKSFSKPVELINKENFDIDEFLDAINIITKDLNSVTQATHDLIEVERKLSEMLRR